MQPDNKLMRFVVHIAKEEGLVKVYEGKPLGSLDTGWNELPDKPIMSLAYINPYGDRVVLSDYEEYNHMVECVQRIGGRPHVTDVYLMGAKGDKVTVYKITAFQEAPDAPVQVGDVTVRVYPRGQEYLGSETWGWRKGIT